MLRQRNVAPSENVALGDMTSSMVFIIHIHSLMDMSHICKRKGWFSPLSMQNIIFQHKMVLDDFFYIQRLHPSEENAEAEQATACSLELQSQQN